MVFLTKSHSTKVFFNWEASQTFPSTQQLLEYLIQGQAAARCQEGEQQPQKNLLFLSFNTGGFSFYTLC